MLNEPYARATSYSVACGLPGSGSRRLSAPGTADLLVRKSDGKNDGRGVYPGECLNDCHGAYVASGALGIKRGKTW